MIAGLGCVPPVQGGVKSHPASGTTWHMQDGTSRMWSPQCSMQADVAGCTYCRGCASLKAHSCCGCRLDCCLLRGLTQMKHRLSRAENCTQWLLAWHERKDCRTYELQSWPHTA